MIPETGTPDKVTQEYLVAAGFKSTNDRAIIPLLKFLGLLEQNGTPTVDYRQLRDRSQFGAILASHIRTAYNELFSLFPNQFRSMRYDLPRWHTAAVSRLRAGDF